MPNHLAYETSPYLQQHAENPVDWYPWGEAALSLAQSANKPILLSIGYSACHWCHVMAHESFEDPATAAVMNEYFVNIKGDREERPDLDQIYQTAHYLLTQRSGGWPLNVFLTPGQIPFFAGTYFPKTQRYSLPAFKDLLPRIAAFYHANTADIENQNATLLEALTPSTPSESQEPTELPLVQLRKYLQGAFDPVFGGFGKAPKFPHVTQIEFLLREYGLRGDREALDMAVLTLKKMAHGGIYDQVGGGFARYSVDERWAIPHFEKMLYDNGPLLSLYSDAYVATGEPLFKQIVAETCAWVMREMQSPEGGYYSSLDADSEHVEGKFYVWTLQEIAAILAPEEFQIAALYYGLDLPANFEGSHWHLIVARAASEISKALQLPIEQVERLLRDIRNKLFIARSARVHPGRDEKILSSWNALMIKGMAHAGRVFEESSWIVSAQRACDFIFATLWRAPRLMATYKDGRAHLNAYLDDYAFLLDALLELLQAEFRFQDLEFARDIADALLSSFEDPATGGFFFTSHDHEKLIHRLKVAQDNATPSGNGVAAMSLLRLGTILEEQRYQHAASRTLHFYYGLAAAHPAGHDSLIMALDDFLHPIETIILRGSGAALAEWRRATLKNYHPRRLVFALDNGLTKLPEALNKPVAGINQAWICVKECLPPISELPNFERWLNRTM